MTASPFVRVQRTRAWALPDLRELWQYRDLLLLLAGRDIRLRYKQTFLGVGWVVLQPLLAAVIFTVIFGRLARMPSDGIPYLLFAFTNLVGWNYFSGAVTRAGNSLVSQSAMVTKVYFPRLLIPLSSALAAAVDLAVALAVLGVLLAWYGVWPGANLLALPLYLALATLAAWGASFWLSAAAVYYRDFAYAMPFLIQIWMYVTPVVFPLTLVPERWRPLFALNPLCAPVEGIRWAALGRGTVGWSVTLPSVAVALVLLFTGMIFFRRVQRTFADVI